MGDMADDARDREFEELLEESWIGPQRRITMNDHQEDESFEMVPFKRDDTWRTKDGREIPVSLMNPKHLANALRFCRTTLQESLEEVATIGLKLSTEPELARQLMPAYEQAAETMANCEKSIVMLRDENERRQEEISQRRTIVQELLADRPYNPRFTTPVTCPKCEGTVFRRTQMSDCDGALNYQKFTCTGCGYEIEQYATDDLESETEGEERKSKPVGKCSSCGKNFEYDPFATTESAWICKNHDCDRFEKGAREPVQ